MEPQETSPSPDNGVLLAERFRVLGVLGNGGASLVYRVKDCSQDGKELALKILTNKEDFDEHVVARFIEELRICREIRHPHLIEAYELVQADGMVGFTMEVVDGKDLGSLLGKRKFTAEEITRICAQVLEALEALHRRGIVHRDVKLENIMLRSDGAAKLTDLGLMKSDTLGGLTKTGILLGTAQYMPPEYVLQQQYDERGDIYALGIVLYELLTERRRLVDKNGNEALEYLIKTKFEVQKMTLHGIPKSFLPVLFNALDPNPKNRYQTADQMRLALLKSALGAPGVAVQSGVDLEKLTRQRKERVAPAPQVPPSMRRLLAAAGAGALVAVMGFAGWKSLSSPVPVPVSAQNNEQATSLAAPPSSPNFGEVESSAERRQSTDAPLKGPPPKGDPKGEPVRPPFGRRSAR